MITPLAAQSIFPLLRTTGLYEALSRETPEKTPQKPNEEDFVFALRKILTAPISWADRESAALAGTVQSAVSTPEKRAAASAAQTIAKPTAQAANAGVPADRVAQSFDRNAVSDMVQWAKNRGATITSTTRSQADNKRVGGVGNSFHLSGRAFDSTPPGGMKMNDWAQELRAKYPGWDIINEGDHVHVEPPSGGAGGGMPAFVNPFNPSYHNQALGEINRAEQAAMQPQVLGTQGPAPEIPDMIIPAKTDFSAADQWLAELKPVEMMETEKRQIEREGWFKGLAQAASSISGGEGIGTMFLRLGAGALGGGMAGKDEVRARMDQFDKKLSQWQLLNFQNEGQKAQVVAQEARQEAAMMNEHAFNKFKIAYGEWEKDAPKVFGDAVVTTKVNEDGSRTLTRTPIRGAIASAFALHRAQTLSALGGLQNNANSMVASAMNGLIANEAAQMFAQSLSGGSGVSGQEGQDALVTAQAMSAANVVKYGRLLDVVPDLATAKDAQGRTMDEEINQQMQAIGITPMSEGYAEKREEMIAERLLRMGTVNKTLMERIMNAGGVGLVMDQAARIRDRTERQSVDSRGRPTSSVTYRGQE